MFYHTSIILSHHYFIHFWVNRNVASVSNLLFIKIFEDRGWDILLYQGRFYVYLYQKSQFLCHFHPLRCKCCGLNLVQKVKGIYKGFYREIFFCPCFNLFSMPFLSLSKDIRPFKWLFMCIPSSINFIAWSTDRRFR